MDAQQDILHRLTELEIKASYADDTIEQLNAVILQQGKLIEALMRHVAELRDQMPAAGEGASAFRNLRDELPPHY